MVATPVGPNYVRLRPSAPIPQNPTPLGLPQPRVTAPSAGAQYEVTRPGRLPAGDQADPASLSHPHLPALFPREPCA